MYTSRRPCGVRGVLAGFLVGVPAFEAARGLFAPPTRVCLRAFAGVLVDDARGSALRFREGAPLSPRRRSMKAARSDKATRRTAALSCSASRFDFLRGPGYLPFSSITITWYAPLLSSLTVTPLPLPFGGHQSHVAGQRLSTIAARTACRPDATHAVMAVAAIVVAARQCAP